jgi:phosphoribosylformimino-5-aminoimidazole carboxamide ribotide isomerase
MGRRYISMMHIFPAIDLRGEKVVRLEQGRADAETVYGADPVAVAEGFQTAGATHLHMVDLDGAFTGELKNLHLVAAVRRATPLFLELGGGMRSESAVAQALEAGVDRVVIGTRACESLEFLFDLVRKFGVEKIAVGIDSKDGIVSTRGWTAPSPWTAPDLARAVVDQGVRTIIYTDIATDGMFTGPNLGALRELAAAVPRARIIASGGVANIEHIASLRTLGEAIDGVIIGKALYDGKLKLPDALRASGAAEEPFLDHRSRPAGVNKYMPKTFAGFEVLLVPFTDELMERLEQSKEAFSRRLDHDVHPQFPAEDFKKALPLFIQRRRESPAERNLGFLILLPAANLVVGSIGAKVLPAGDEIEVGYDVVPDMRGRGVATEALQLFTRHCFSSGLAKIIRAGCLEANMGSVRVLEKAGFLRSGTVTTSEGLSIAWILKS